MVELWQLEAAMSRHCCDVSIIVLPILGNSNHRGWHGIL